jgi:transcriptional regulator with XRE-family HTH domain
MTTTRDSAVRAPNGLNAAEDKSLGERLGRELRRRRRMLDKTMQDVAREAGLSVGFISQVERGLSSPSLASLSSIAKALSASIEDFVATPEPSSVVSRQAVRVSYSVGTGGRAYEHIGRGFDGALLNACIVHIPLGHKGQRATHEGEEFIYLLKGRMRYELDGEIHVLGPHDTIHFQSGQPHQSENIGDEPATELWVGTMKLFR